MTRLGLGTAPLGNLFKEVSDTDAAQTVRFAWDSGLRLFDTAPNYGYGLAERRVGALLRERPRDEFVLATKVGRLLRADAPHDPWRDTDDPLYKYESPVGQVPDYSYDGTMRSVEESLARLGLDRVDILHIHDPDDHAQEALKGAYAALAELRSQGVIRAVSVGMNQSALLAWFAREADFDCFLLANRYTLLDQTALADALPACVERGIGVIIGGVYNSGLLANPVPEATYDYVRADDGHVARALRLQDVCGRYGVPLKAAAIQFPLAYPAVATVLTGVRSAAELAENQDMMRYPVPADLWAELQSEGFLPAEAPLPAPAAGQ